MTTSANHVDPTGCGKSILLDILADRKDASGLSGQVCVNGRSLPDAYKLLVGYVVQDDIISGTLTVRENLMFSANVRLSDDVSGVERKERVRKIIDDLGLTDCADTRVGNEFSRGVSDGERKRTCFGMELLLSPQILFPDEPTTGQINQLEEISNRMFSSRIGRIDRSKCNAMSPRSFTTRT